MVEARGPGPLLPLVAAAVSEGMAVKLSEKAA